ncbi:MAG: hypothetical protein ACRCUY_11375 [Thermoguttaceae bacterium]
MAARQIHRRLTLAARLITADLRRRLAETHWFAKTVQNNENTGTPNVHYVSEYFAEHTIPLLILYLGKSSKNFEPLATF